MIKDSGNRRQFNSGAVRDIQEGKGRCDLLPLETIGIQFGDLTLAEIGKFKNTGDPSYLQHALETCEFYPDFYTMLLEVSKHFEEGAKKYGEENWQKGMPTHCYVDSAVRHYLKHKRGDDDEPHNRSFCWNILTALWTCYNKPDYNDYLGGSDNDLSRM